MLDGSHNRYSMPIINNVLMEMSPTNDAQGNDRKAGVWVKDAPVSLPIFLLGPKESDVDRPRQRLSRDSPLIFSKGQAPLLKASPLQ